MSNEESNTNDKCYWCRAYPSVAKVQCWKCRFAKTQDNKEEKLPERWETLWEFSCRSLGYSGIREWNDYNDSDGSGWSDD